MRKEFRPIEERTLTEGLLAANLHFDVDDSVVDFKSQIEPAKLLTPIFRRDFDVKNLDVLNRVSWYFE